LEIPEQQVGESSSYIFTVFSNATADYAIRSYVLEDGTMETDIALGAYYPDWSWAGFFEYLPSATWTKISNKAAALDTHGSININSSRIKRVSKNIK